MSAFRGEADIADAASDVRFRAKVDIGERRFDHFQPASLTRYDVGSELGASR
jgi:hypothetical protein